MCLLHTNRGPTIGIIENRPVTQVALSLNLDSKHRNSNKIYNVLQNQIRLCCRISFRGPHLHRHEISIFITKHGGQTDKLNLNYKKCTVPILLER